MEITNNTEVNLYKVTKLESSDEIMVVAIDFSDLQKDLIENCIEPIKIELIGEVYITNGILGKQEKK